MPYYKIMISGLSKYFSPLLIVSVVFALVSFESNLSAQARMVMNDDVYLKMNGGTPATPIYLVVDNPNGNAITTTGAGGNLLSENEYNKVRWNIGANTGIYTLPYTTGTGTNVKMPLTYSVTTAGSGGTPIDFSTYPTAIDNTPYASMVTNVLDQNTETIDNSAYILDRFWIIDAMNYTTRPAAEMTMGYDPNETAGNIVAPGNLFAQRFNSTTNSWTGGGPGNYLFFGTDNAPLQQVENISVPSNEMYAAWTLFDHTNPLPVELTYFTVACQENFVQLEWETASEKNASHFIIEKSIDGQNWDVVKEIPAQGYTSSSTVYSYSDYQTRNEVVYYRLVQVDFDGQEIIFGAESAAPCAVEELTWIVSTHDNDLYGLTILSPKNQEVTLIASAMSGQRVAEPRTLNLVAGKNLYYFDAQHLVVGMYLLNLLTPEKTLTHKLLKQQ